MRPAPTGFSAWRVVAAMVVLQFVFGIVFTWGAVAPYVRSQDHWPPLLVGAVFSATPLGYGFGMVLAGRLADSYPPRRLCWAAVCLLVVGFAVAFVLPSGFTFVVFYSGLALGLGGGIALAGAVAALRQVWPRRVGAVGGLMTGCYAAASLVQIPVVSRLAGALGWIAALRITGTVMVVISVLFLALMPSLPRPERQSEERIRLGRLFLRLGIWSGFLLELSAPPVGTFAFVSVAGLARADGLDEAIATLAVTVVAAGNVTGRLLGGAASDRLGGAPVVLGILLADLASAGLLLSGWVAVPALLVAGAGAGLALGGGAGVMTRLAATAAPDAPNSAFGLLFAGYATGAFSGPLLGALAGGRLAWAVLAAPALFGLLVLALRVRAS